MSVYQALKTKNGKPLPLLERKEEKALGELIKQVLDIESPTYKEKPFYTFIKNRLKSKAKVFEKLILTGNEIDGLIVEFKESEREDKKKKPHVILVGHVDVVGEWFKSYVKGDFLHGRGASDMKGSVGVYLHLLELLCQKNRYRHLSYRLSVVLYSREEGTKLEDNGLYSMLRNHRAFFKSVNLAIVGEPTEGMIHLGALGSLHAEMTFFGKSAHSARPWQGSNAIYQAVSFLKAFSTLKPKKIKVGGLDFFEVFQITHAHSNRIGKSFTTLPHKFTARVNYRYAPFFTPRQAFFSLTAFLKKIKTPPNMKLEIVSNTKGATPLSSPFFDSFIKKAITNLSLTLHPKQAWTDVAQLTDFSIPSLNYGLGLPSQAHQKNEYLSLKLLTKYTQDLKFLLGF